MPPTDHPHGTEYVVVIRVTDTKPGRSRASFKTQVARHFTSGHDDREGRGIVFGSAIVAEEVE